MDDLNYIYDSGNKLLRVEDTANDIYGFKDDAIAVPDDTDDYAYDDNGNMISDTNKGITSISYNYMNLPVQITINGENIFYIYDASGGKQQKIADGTTTTYAGSYSYENGSLKFISHPEGYIEPDGIGGYNYVYQYTDHLGNKRLSYSDSNDDGAVDTSEILEENNYYPFGLIHQGYNSVVSGTHYPYTFNGKEEQSELDLEWLDFGARNYDATLGRWMNIDPLAENSRRWTPYNYAYNNPVYFIDPDGMQATDWYENADGQIVYDENINSQEGLDAAGIEGEYIADSFVAKDQNNDIFVFNEDGTVTDSDATASMMETAGVDTSDMIEVESTMVDDGKNDVTEASLGVAAFLVADDATVIGAVDDVLLPIVAIVAGVAALAETAPTFSFSKEASDAGEATGAEHTSGARPSTKRKHERGRARKARDRGGEKRGHKEKITKKKTAWTQRSLATKKLIKKILLK